MCPQRAVNRTTPMANLYNSSFLPYPLFSLSLKARMSWLPSYTAAGGVGLSTYVTLVLGCPDSDPDSVSGLSSLQLQCCCDKGLVTMQMKRDTKNQLLGAVNPTSSQVQPKHRFECQNLLHTN